MAIADADRWHIGRTQLFNGESRKPGPQSMTQVGDELRLTGTYWENTELPLAVFRQQMLGLNEEPEPVPLIAPDDFGLTGFYMVRAAQFVHVKAGEDQGHAQYSFTLVRAASYGLPAVDLIVDSSVRSDAVADPLAVDTDEPLVWIPSDAVWDQIATAAGDLATRSTDTGDVRTTVSAGGDQQMVLQPADFYDGSACIEVLTGATWSPLVGDQVPSSITGLRVGNGIIRMTFNVDGDLAVDCWDGSAWDAVGDFNLKPGNDTEPAATLPTLIPVVHRNTPEQVVVKMYATYDASGATYGQQTHPFTVNVQRGESVFALTVTPYIKVGRTGGLFAKTTTAATSLTGGIRQTSNGATGHRWLMASDEVIGPDTTNGGITFTGNPSELGLGVEVGGSSATGQDVATSVVAQYWRPKSISQRIVKP